VAGRCLHHLCDSVYKVVPTYKTVFDVILEAHSKGGHAKGIIAFLFFLFIDFYFIATKISVFSSTIYLFDHRCVEE
jgi:hypothetical protein